MLKFQVFPVSPACTRLSLRLSSGLSLLVLSFGTIACSGLLTPIPASAQSQKYAFVQPKESSEAAEEETSPMLMTLISLNKQRMWVYDANGVVAQSRVSTGRSGYDTPKGIYSIIQKKKDHASNLYDSAPMPNMQRLLWTGIAMHGGQVPNYPASHGCVRLPWDFAGKYFDMTALNHRVVISPDVQAPVPISHPQLFSAIAPVEAIGPSAVEAGNALSVTRLAALSTEHAVSELIAERDREKERILAEEQAAKDEVAKANDQQAAAEDGVERAREALAEAKADLKDKSKLAYAAKKDAGAITKSLKKFSRNIERKAKRMRADQLIAMRADEAKLATEVSQAEEKANAAERAADQVKEAIASAERRIAETQKAAKDARQAVAKAQASEAQATAAVEAFQLGERNRPKPLTVFISRSTGRVSLRQGFEPIFEANVKIEKADRPLGTYVYTAIGWRDGSEKDLEWRVAAVNEKGLGQQRSSNRDARRPPPSTDVRAAAEALERITIPHEALVRIGEVIKPGSTLIISDYDKSRSETSKGTDVIVQMPEVVASVAEARRKQNKPKLNSRSYSLGAAPRRDPDYYEDYPPPSAFKNPKKSKFTFFGPPPERRGKRPFYRKFDFEYLGN